MSEEPLDTPPDDPASLARGLRQRLESLRRAGLDYLPAAGLVLPARVEPRPAPAQTAAPTPARAPSLPPVEAPVRNEAPAPAPAAPVARPPAPTPAPTPVAAPALFGEPGIEAPAVPPGERPARLAELAAEVAACQKCPMLATTRTQTVFGVGSPTARLMFIGEAPGAQEDRTGVPFVGPAGQLLTDMITKGMGLTRDEVYIANVLKSRPPNNRDPLPDEIAHCLPYLDRQIAIVRPEFICLLGKIAASAMLETMLSLSRLRKRWHRVRGIPAVVTYHPSYLLRNPSAKKDAWEDLQMLMKAMGITPPGRKG